VKQFDLIADGTKRSKVAGGWRKARNERLHYV